MATELEQVISGYAHDSQRLALLAGSEGIPSQDPTHYRQRIELAPMPGGDLQTSQSIALLPYDPTTALLARAQLQDSQPLYQYILLPYDVGGLDALFRLFSQPISLEASGPLKLPAPDDDFRVARLQRFISQMLDGDFELAMSLLGAALHERGLLIQNFPPDFPQRAALIQGIHALLPSSAALRLSFASHSIQSSAAEAQLVFDDSSEKTARWICDWEAPRRIEDLPKHPYTQGLLSLWTGDIHALAAAIEDMDALGFAFDADASLSGHLAALAERFSLDRRVEAEDAVETDAMMQALNSGAPPQGILRVQYITKLLENALNHRDDVAGLRVAEELERDDELEPILAGLFDDMLENQPDAVYVFIRNRFNHLGIDEKWLPRLQLAAANSLEVAIQEGGTPTLARWLELAAHEPRAYQLLEVLRQGILSAQPRARQDGELGIRLILIATRRLPELADILHQDAPLIDALAVHARRVLQAATASDIKTLAEESPAYFLLALFHGMQADRAALVTTAMVDSLWRLYQSGVKNSLPARHQPAALVRHLAAQASHHMAEPAIDALLRHIIAIGDTGLFIEMAKHLAGRDTLFPRLGSVLEDDDFTPDTILAVMNAVGGIGGVLPQELLDTWFILLDYYAWAPETQPMMEALVRHMGIHPALHASYRHLWKLCETCNALHIETVTRAAIQRLLQQFAAEEDEQVIIAGLARLCRQIDWSRTLPATVNAWWRDYTGTRSFMQLQRLERDLDAVRHLETQKQILKTALAMRRLMHDRDPLEFAAAINTACTLIEDIADAFDAARLTEVDPPIIRRELDDVSAELSTDAQHVLANNLRNLAARIILMANNRSKPSLIRSDDSIDRQLMLGEANPHGSIDMMKWIAGYLGGAHSDASD